MKGKTVVVLISEDGESTSIDLANFHGQGCTKVINDFAAGNRIKLERTKAEYNERVQQQEQAKQ